jgi:beta-N-acetylhexosaminidase
MNGDFGNIFNKEFSTDGCDQDAGERRHEINVGQFLCGGFQGTTVTPQAYHLIVEHKISAMILSLKNAVSVKQMSKLIKDLQWIAYSQGKYKYPLMFAIDEEGGMMNSLFDSEFLTQYPAAMALAATGDPDLAYEVSKALAIELKKIGFLMILGPVLDVITKLSHQLVGVRSFGTTIEDVTKYGAKCAKGLQDGGLFTVGKHFPGIGNATVDSLLELPMMADSLDQVRHFNSVPFAKLIQQGYLDGIGASGCGIPSISPDETHACLSPVIINQLVRQEMKFDGIVISECLEMDALYHSIGLGQGVILAISAGCDLVLVCHDLKLQNEAIQSLKKAIENGTLDEELLSGSLSRIERLQKRMPTWSEIFPNGETSAKEEPVTLKESDPELWKAHQELSDKAYQKSITLIRDYNSTIPITRFLNSNTNDESDKILILTPLLNPIYQKHTTNDLAPQLFAGETVFQEFGKLLSEHPLSEEKSYNVLHTTYTANGLTPLHESLIAKAKIVMVFTSEASRNMYQIGIVKYVSILCGANPNSLGGNTSTSAELSKPLVIVATLSPYDFFYNKSIGSAYMCCYDYTTNSLKQLVAVLMGDVVAEGCIPGEEKFSITKKKRKLSDKTERTIKKNNIPKRKWLVDEFDLNRDWTGLVKLWKNNSLELQNSLTFDYQSEGFYKRLFALLMSTSKQQTHFVIRNSSLNILYGIILTWTVEDTILNENLTQEPDIQGVISYILVDKSKRLQNLGKNLLARATRYLIKEKKCSSIRFGGSFPLLFGNNAPTDQRTIGFLSSVHWTVNKNTKKNRIMAIHDLKSWQVSKKIFRELMIVGVRFDVCTDLEKLVKLVDKAASLSIDNGMQLKQIYVEAIKHIGSANAYGVKIVIALEPTNQSVIGSIILFTNKSQLSKFYPFIDECLGDETKVDGDSTAKTPLVGAITAPLIDPLYSNLTEIFRYGLICSAITSLKSSVQENETPMKKCIIIGVEDDSSINSVKEIGFEEWKEYHDYYDQKASNEF